MANDKRTSEIILKYTVDEKALSDVDKRTQALMARFDNMAKSANETGSAAAEAGSGLQTMAGQSEQLARSMQAGEEAARRQAAAINETAGALDNYGSAASSVRSVDLGSSLSGVSSSLRQAGLGGAADVTGIGADIAQAVEGFEQLAPALRNIGTQAAASISSFTGLEVGIGAVAAGAGVLVVGIAAVMVALEAWKTENEKTVQAIESWIAGVQNANAFLRGDPTAEEAARQLEDWNREIRDNQEQIDLLKQSYGQLTTNFGVFTHLLDAADARGIRTMREEWDRLEERNRELNLSIGELSNTEAQAQIAATELTNKEAELAELRGSIAQQRIDALMRKEEEAARARYQQGIDDLNMRRKYADFEASIRDIGDVSGKVSDLKAASANRITALNDSFADFLKKAEQRVADVNTDLAKRKGELERDYMQAALKDTETYLKREKEANEDYQRDRVRAIQDMYDGMLSAEESNDVIAFIQAQRAGEKRIKQMDEDAAVESKRRAEEFVTLQKERREEFKKQLADIQAAAAERIAAIRREISDRRTLLAQQISEERAALRQRIQDVYTAAQQEIAMRKQAFAASLAQEQQYATARLALERNLQSQLLQIASTYASSKSIYSTGGTSSKLPSPTSYPTSSYSMPSASTLSKTSGTTTVNISTGNIGSNLTQTEVNSSLNDLARILSGTIVKSYSGGSGSFGITA